MKEAWLKLLQKMIVGPLEKCYISNVTYRADNDELDTVNIHLKVLISENPFKEMLEKFHNDSDGKK